MNAVSLLRLNLLRAAYAFVAIGIGLVIWPSIFSHGPGWPLMSGVVSCMMAGVSVLALFGLRYPLQLLPVLLFELVWKTIWLSAVALPLWAAGRMDPRTMESAIECLLAIVLIPLIPWGYVVRTYVRQPGAPWRRPAKEG